jgi:uncharacterized SAM-dependent methyltransferase
VALGVALLSSTAPLSCAISILGTLVKLGPGNGETGGAHRVRRVTAGQLDHLVDVSPAALAAAVRTLVRSSRCTSSARSHVQAGLAELAGERGAGRTLVLFLGSNIGNFDPRAPTPSCATFAVRSAPGARAVAPTCTSPPSSSPPTMIRLRHGGVQPEPADPH